MRFILSRLKSGYHREGTFKFTQEEVQSLIQSLEAERDQYFKDYGSNKFSFVREIAERAIEQNNRLIQKLETMIGKSVRL